MASAIFFAGRRINIPQAVTAIDASGLPSSSPAAVGTVAIIGTAEGGAPLSVVESDSDATQPSAIQKRYRSGDLRTAALFAFQPSADPAVPGGAQKVIGVKVNPSTSAAVTLPDVNSADSLRVFAKDSGLFTSQINVEVAAGTDQGKKFTVTFEDHVEVFDDLGGEPIFDVLYAPGGAGYTTVTGAISSTAFTAAATKATTGLSAQRSADIPAPGVTQVVSSNAGDTTQAVTTYGLSGGNVVSETLALNGTTPVVGTQSFDTVLGCKMSAVALGTVTVKDTVIPTTLFSMTTGQTTRGYLATTNTPAAGAVTTTIDTNAADDFVILGINSVGAPVSQKVDLTNAASVPVVGTTQFAAITALLLGDVAGARTVTISLSAAKTLHSSFSTVQKVVDRLNSLDGFTANADVSNPTTFRMADADYSPAVSLIGSPANFYADTFVIAAVLTSQSQYVSASRAPGGLLLPANTVAPVFLAGGDEGVVTITQWQQALDLLKKRRYNHLVVLSRDPAVHAAALAHLVLKNGLLKSEAQGIIGLAKSDGTGETRANIQSQIQALASRHLAFVSQRVEKFDPISGEATLYPPYFLAAVMAGVKAGSAVAEPMTHKTIIATNIDNDSSWSVEDDASALIDRGLMMMEKVDSVGIRCVRSVTGHLADDNPIFTEYSANESLITSIFRLRNVLEKKIGGRGLPGTVGALVALANAELNAQKDEEVIFDFNSLQIDQIGDVFPVSVAIAPIQGINFIPITIHLTQATAQQAA